MSVGVDTPADYRLDLLLNGPAALRCWATHLPKGKQIMRKESVFDLLKSEITEEQKLQYLRLRLAQQGQNENKLKNGEGEPCFDCGGTDRSYTGRGNQKGKALHTCRSCGSRDVVKVVQDLDGVSNVEACKLILDHFSVSYDGPAASLPPIEDGVAAWCEEKGICPETFKSLWATKPYRRGDAGASLEGAFMVRIIGTNGKVHPDWGQAYAPRAYGNFVGFSKGMNVPKGGKSGIVWSRTPKAGDTVFIAEGIKDLTLAAKIHRENGFNDFVYCGFFGSGSFKPEYARHFEGCHLVQIPDLDNAGFRYATEVHGKTLGFFKSFNIVRLAGQVKESNGQDLRDCYKADKSAAEYALLNPRPYTSAPVEEEGGQQVKMYDVTDMTEAEKTAILGTHLALIGSKTEKGEARFYASPSDNRLVRIEPSEQGAKIAAHKSPHALVTALTAEVGFYKEAPKKDSDKECEKKVVSLTLTQALTLQEDYRTRKEVPVLHRIANAPSLRADWSVNCKLGFDIVSGTYNDFDKTEEVPHSPTLDDAKAAYSDLLDVFSDFNFENDQHRSVAVAGILSLLTSSAHKGNQPLIHGDATAAGSGKSLCIDIITRIGSGRAAPAANFTTDDNELEKRITSLLASGVNVLSFDNLSNSGVFGSPIIDSLLTKSYHQSRILGSNSAGSTASFRAYELCCFSSANNVSIGSDLKRRMLIFRLLPSTEQGLRSYRHNWLTRVDADAQSRYSRLTAAALTILRAYDTAGRPSSGVKKLDSFENWHDFVVEPIIWASEGQHNPYQSRELLDSRDRTGNRQASLILGISAAYELFNIGRATTITTLCQKLTQFKKDRDNQSEVTTLTETESAALELYQLASHGKGEPNAERLSYIAKQFDGSDMDGVCIRFGKTSRQETVKVALSDSKRGIATYNDVINKFNNADGEVQDTPNDERPF